MKGYIDRVFSYGFAYRYDQGIQRGLLGGKQAVIVNTQGKSHEEYQATGMDRALALTSDKGIYQYCGMQIRHHVFLEKADRFSAAQVEAWTNELIRVY